MIDFRYHIISLVAVFLALGVGIVVGTSGALDPLVSQQFTDQVSRLEREVARSHEELTDLRERFDHRDTLLDEITPWAIGGLLTDRPVVFVFDTGSARWTADAQESVLRAGATSAGRLTLSAQWNLEVEGAAAELQALVEEIVPAFDPRDDPATATLRLVGERLFDPTGRALVEALVDAGFLTLDGASAQPWPPQGAAVIFFGSEHAESSDEPGWLAGLAVGVSTASPALVVSGSPEEHTVVRVVRALDNVPENLATFDAGADDPTGIGTVLSLQAAIAGRGGDYGTASGLSFVPDRRQPTPAPTGV